jgi:hypothetical protein
VIQPKRARNVAMIAGILDAGDDPERPAAAYPALGPPAIPPPAAGRAA